MKKKIIKSTLVAAFALIAGYNVYASQKTERLSDLALANVEALAESREFDPDYNPECPYGCVDGGNGCHCYHDYAKYKPYK